MDIQFEHWTLNFEAMIGISPEGEIVELKKLGDCFYCQSGTGWKWLTVPTLMLDVGFAGFPARKFYPDEAFSKRVFRRYEEYLIEEILLK